MTATAGASVSAAAKPSLAWLIEPFTMGTPEQFARVRETFVRIGYTERVLCERAKVRSIYDLAVLPIADTPIGKPADAFSATAHLFLEGARIPWPVVRSLLDRSAIDAFQALGVLASLTGEPDVCIAPLAIYPVAGLYIASDRYGSVFDVATGLPPDLVYAALTPEARDFVRLMPRVPCDDYLELCSGTGIAALIAARSFAKHAWGIDITERSTRFARFNAALNGLENATMLEGDLFAPVAGQTFDLITAHPPYVPSLDDDMVFRDGGDDGERVTRAILAGVVDHLRPGGRFFCACMLTDRKGQPLESRIRSMLGPSESELDLIVGQRMQYDIEAHFANAAKSGQITKETLQRMLNRFQELGVERFVGTGFLVRRLPEHAGRSSLTRRRVTTRKTTGAHLEWSLEWSALAANLDREPGRVLDARATAGGDVKLRSQSALRDGKWSVTSSTLTTETPFEAEVQCPSWVAMLLVWCDGTVTVREHLERLRSLDLVTDDVGDETFAKIVRKLAEGGFIELDLCPLPRVLPDPPVVA